MTKFSPGMMNEKQARDHEVRRPSRRELHGYSLYQASSAVLRPPVLSLPRVELVTRGKLAITSGDDFDF